MRPFILAALAVVFSLSGALAQSSKPVTTTFWVGGTCDMCKKRIEGAVDLKGVKYASYDLSRHELTVTYVPSRITEEELHRRINAVGHDTSRSSASEAAYDSIHGCCRYRGHHDRNPHNE